MLMTDAICGVILPKDKTKSNSLLIKKSGALKNLWLVSSLF